MHIKILGPGCANCHALQARAVQALTQLEVTAEVTTVTDYPTIVGYGVMATPALVIDDRVVMTGRVPPTREVADLIEAARTGTAA